MHVVGNLMRYRHINDLDLKAIKIEFKTFRF